MASKEIPMWRDRYPVLDQVHHNLLDISAAQHEFRGGMTKEQAEDRAHKDYLRDQAIKAAAYHYLGTRAAIAAGHQEAAKQHGFAYTQALRAMGLDPTSTPPQEVLDATKDIDHNPYSFKNHEADHFFRGSPEPPPKDEKARTLELIENLKALAKKPK